MLSTLFTISAFTLLTAQTQVIPPPVTVTVPQWSTYDITLIATGRYESPYVAVDLLGVFTGPNGEGIVVNGFWDGGQTFRVRFTPTVEGTWTFVTVSDDAGLDAHSGVITCVKPKEGEHGFVRMSGGRPGWSYDDGLPFKGTLEGDAAIVRVRARAEQCGGDGDSCREPVGPGRDYIDAAKLQAADARVRSAAAAGRLVEIELLDADDAAAFAGPRLYRYLEYMTARYAALPNVVWCLHPTAPRDGSIEFWRRARSLVKMLDPYSGDAPRVRVLSDQCSPPAKSR